MDIDEETVDVDEETLDVRLVDPTTLIIRDNVRLDTAPAPNFVAHIAAYGVREVVRVEPDGDDLVVLTGERRVRGAIEAGRKRIRVLVEQPVGGTEDERRIERLIVQLDENHQRVPLTDADEVRAAQQLLGLGLTAGDIADRRKIRPQRARALATVAASPAAFAAVEAGTLDLFQSAELAEFDDDPAARAELEAVATRNPEQFGYTVRRLREERAERDLLAEARARLEAAGVRVLGDEQARSAVPLRMLRPALLSEPGTELMEAGHRGCPGHAAILAYRRHEAGGDPVQVSYVCTDFVANGHAERMAAAAGETADLEDEEEETDSGPATATPAQPASEEDRERRRVIAENDRLWQVATAQRLEWLARFVKSVVKSRAMRANVDPWVASVLASSSMYARRAADCDKALPCRLLGLGRDDGDRAASGVKLIEGALERTSSAGAQSIVVALVIAGYEQLMPRRGWQGVDRLVAGYMRQLGRWGYPLSDIEMAVVASHFGREEGAGGECVDEA
jgi:ParB family transcriptional regulator, chromosome partitioning protein